MVAWAGMVGARHLGMTMAQKPLTNGGEHMDGWSMSSQVQVDNKSEAERMGEGGGRVGKVELLLHWRLAVWHVDGSQVSGIWEI